MAFLICLGRALNNLSAWMLKLESLVLLSFDHVWVGMMHFLPSLGFVWLLIPSFTLGTRFSKIFHVYKIRYLSLRHSSEYSFSSLRHVGSYLLFCIL